MLGNTMSNPIDIAALAPTKLPKPKRVLLLEVSAAEWRVFVAQHSAQAATPVQPKPVHVRKPRVPTLGKRQQAILAYMNCWGGKHKPQIIARSLQDGPSYPWIGQTLCEMAIRGFVKRVAHATYRITAAGVAALARAEDQHGQF